MMVVSLQQRCKIHYNRAQKVKIVSYERTFTKTHLWAAAVAAASIANWRIVLSSRYFCSQRVMSASKARMRSSLSLRRCCKEVTFRLDMEVLIACCPWDCHWKQTRQMVSKKIHPASSSSPKDEWGFTCCALRLFSSCSSRVRSFISRASLFSHAAWSWAKALCSLSTFSTYALFLRSSSSSCLFRVWADTKACSSTSRRRHHSSPEALRHCNSRSSCSRSRWRSSSKHTKRDREYVTYFYSITGPSFFGLFNNTTRDVLQKHLWQSSSCSHLEMNCVTVAETLSIVVKRTTKWIVTLKF